jgi:hypothetical protein
MAADPSELAVSYAFAVDQRDATALAALFAPDARIDLPAAMTGRDAPATSIAPDEVLGRLTRWARTRHVVLHQRIEAVDDMSATGECYGEAHHVSVRGDGARDLVLHVRYLDRYARIDGDWLFAGRQLVVDWSAELPVRLWD